MARSSKARVHKGPKFTAVAYPNGTVIRWYKGRGGLPLIAKGKSREFVPMRGFHAKGTYGHKLKYKRRRK